MNTRIRKLVSVAVGVAALSCAFGASAAWSCPGRKDNSEVVAIRSVGMAAFLPPPHTLRCAAKSSGIASNLLAHLPAVRSLCDRV